MFSRVDFVGSRRIILVVLLSVPFFSAWAGDSRDWPGWRGPNLNGVVLTDQKLEFTENLGLMVAWKIKLGSGYSSVSIVGNQAVTMFSDGTKDYVGSFDATTGAEQWRTQIDAAYKGHDGSHDGPLSTPLIEGERVYVLGPNGQLSALGLADGKMIWSLHLQEDLKSVLPFYGFTTSPLVCGDHLIVETGAENRAISAFDKNTGKRVWSMGNDAVNYQSPTLVQLHGKKHLLFAGNEYLYGINPKTGEELWQYHHDFKTNSMNPVAIGTDTLLINSVGRETALLKVSAKSDGIGVRELWRSRELAGSHNPPVYKDGYLYGYSRRFLACVDAKTGELAWKSRAPGDGFLIRVNDTLVIIARRGTLHVIEANPEKYHELASLALFDAVCWTPASFASGKIYVRSVEEMACVEFGKVDQVLIEVAQEGPSMKVPESEFGKFVAKVEASKNKKERIDEFMKKQTVFPIIEAGKYAHIVYRGPVRDLTIVADMIDTNTEAPMNRIEGTNFYYASFELPADARLNYNFTKDFEERIPDPLNKTIVPSLFGERSQLAMPKFVAASHWQDPKDGLRGALDAFEFDSKVLENKRDIKVYLPAGYAAGTDSYPTLYVNNGNQAVEFAKIPNTLDNLIGKTIVPIIAVFVDAPNSGREYARGQRDQFSEMITQELIPFIDGKYRTLPKAESRAFMGGDEGGYAAIYTAFKYPGTFGMLAGQSTHLLAGHGGEEILAIVQESKPLDVQFYLDWGQFDYRNQPGGYSWIELNKNFVTILKEKGYTVAGGEHHQGWGWASWRENTDKILEHFFPMKKK